MQRPPAASFVVITILTSLSVHAQRPAAPERSIQGVWRVIEQTLNEQTLTDEKLGVGYHIYTPGYYAAVRESGPPPRPDVPDIDKASKDDLLAAWGPFVTQLGTYKVVDDVLSFTSLVAENTGQMTGRGASQRIRFEGETLVLEPVQRTPGARQIDLKMVRVE